MILNIRNVLHISPLLHDLLPIANAVKVEFKQNASWKAHGFLYSIPSDAQTGSNLPQTDCVQKNVLQLSREILNLVLPTKKCMGLFLYSCWSKDLIAFMLVTITIHNAT